MSSIYLKNWYQLDFQIQNSIEDLKKIDSVMEGLRKEKLILKWFFLFEGLSIRVRMHAMYKNGKILKEKLEELSNENCLIAAETLPFSPYAESTESLFNEDVVEGFANIMCEITQLTIKKIKKQTSFNNYRLVERISHCAFDIIATLSGKSEEHSLQQRLLERFRKPFDDNFEGT